VMLRPVELLDDADLTDSYLEDGPHISARL
jgi:hypothetical protein